jgi:hypothetical protein
MIVEKCKRVMMEERHGRRRARRMAREVAGLVGNPLGAATGFAGNAVNSIAGEDMGGGAKVLLLLLGAAAVGGGIYYFATKPAAAATPSPSIPPAVVNPGTTTAAPTGTIAVPAATSSPPAGTSIDTMVSRAVLLANLTRSTGHSGDLPPAIQWASWAVASGANASQLAQLRGAGFIV